MRITLLFLLLSVTVATAKEQRATGMPNPKKNQPRMGLERSTPVYPLGDSIKLFYKGKVTLSRKVLDSLRATSPKQAMEKVRSILADLSVGNFSHTKPGDMGPADVYIVKVGKIPYYVKLAIRGQRLNVISIHPTTHSLFTNHAVEFKNGTTVPNQHPLTVSAE